MSIRVERIDHVVLRVADMARMVAFYRDALGMAVERELHAYGLVQLRAGASLLDLVDTNVAGGGIAQGEARDLDHLCFRVDPFDAEAIARALAPFGIDAGDAVDRYGAEGIGPSIYLTDPEGNRLELKGPAHTPARRPPG